jgi:hypothetical protein
MRAENRCAGRFAPGRKPRGKMRPRDLILTADQQCFTQRANPGNFAKETERNLL